MSNIAGIQTRDYSENYDFSKKTDKTKLTSTDFLRLFILQMQNQDFNEPMDSSQMMNQITQFSNMQMMQEMANYSKSSYALSLVGKSVTAMRYTNTGNLETIDGVIDRVVIEKNEYVFYVGDQKFTLDEIKQVQTAN